jgi:electron transfer flavoprotein alpha subunit
LLVGGTHAGRILASTVAARLGLGLTGDAIDLEVSSAGRLIAWKPAFGGRLVAHIESRSAVQMVTIRPGVLTARSPRADRAVPATLLPAPAPARVVTIATEHVDDGALDIQRASTVIGIGTGVDPAAYGELDALRELLGEAPLAATRRVTDKGWLPRSRQLGVTGKSISPRLYIAIGISGKLNHTIGIRNAQTVLAINNDPDAPVWDHADVGIVGDWREVIPALTAAIAERVSAHAG